MRSLATALILLACVSLTSAQNAQEQPSLGDVARQNRQKQQGRATIITEEDLRRSSRNLIPDVFNDGIDNSDEIIEAILSYHKTHSRAETEDAVRTWYQRHDRQAEQAINENREIEARRKLGYAPPVPPRDYQVYQQMVRDRARQLRYDEDSYQKNGLLLARIQQTFQKVRGRIQMAGMQYAWFKIRFGNGNGSW